MKPGFCSVIHNFYFVTPWHILCVLLTLCGKMAQEWNNKVSYLRIFIKLLREYCDINSTMRQHLNALFDVGNPKETCSLMSHVQFTSCKTF